MSTTDAEVRPAPRRRGIAESTITFFEQTIPDPFVIAVLITVFVAALSALIAPQASFQTIVLGWYKGLFDILTFGFQIILILVTGHTFAHAPPVQRAFKAIVALARTPAQAATVTFLLVAVASFCNFGLGLVVGALLAREVAKRMPVDFAWIVAAGFSGWVVQGAGLSSTIILAQATHGSPMNIVEKLTGQIVPFSQSTFALYNLVPLAVMLVATPLVLIWMKPSERDSVVLDMAQNPDPVPPARPAKMSFARWLEYSPISSLILGAGGLAVFVLAQIEAVPAFSGVNAAIFIVFILGLVLHGYPLAYGNALKNAARQVGSMTLQYPLYGGIMGIMSATGLPGVISNFFVAISTAHTLPFWSYVCSLLMTFLVPSGGGHWAVQGPFVIPAAVTLHASSAATTVAVAMGEQVANMMQPFWAAPVVAMAGVGVQRVLGYTMMIFLLGMVVYGVALLTLV